MMRWQLRPEARRDLEKIRQYTRNTWGALQARAYLRELEGAFRKIAENPKIGRPHAGTTYVYRRISAGSHVIFFRVNDDTLLIVRVLHERMDFDRHL